MACYLLTLNLPRVPGIPYLDAEIGHKLAGFHPFTETEQEADLVIDRFHTLLLGLEPSLQLIKNRLAIRWGEFGKIAVCDVSLVFAQTPRI